MEGWWESPNLTALMQLMAANLGTLDKLESQSSPVTQWLNRFTHWLKRNTIDQAKDNIHQHYDLGMSFINCSSMKRCFTPARCLPNLSSH